MSRSRRKSPFVGYTTAETDKPWKEQSARKARRAVHQTLRETLNGDALPVKRWALTNPWHGLKDGKQRVADPDAKLLRT